MFYVGIDLTKNAHEAAHLSDSSEPIVTDAVVMVKVRRLSDYQEADEPAG